MTGRRGAISGKSIVGQAYPYSNLLDNWLAPPITGGNGFTKKRRASCSNAPGTQFGSIGATTKGTDEAEEEIGSDERAAGRWHPGRWDFLVPLHAHRTQW